MSSLKGGIELVQPDFRYVESIELKVAAYNKAAADVPTAAAMSDVLTSWCKQTETLLDEVEVVR